MSERYDAVIVGGGHNGLVAAALLARAGRRVLLLERDAELGGAARSLRLFEGVDARISAYAYLVSLFPASLREALGLRTRLLRRRVSSYTPVGDTGLLVSDDAARTRASFARMAGDGAAHDAWRAFYGELEELARRLAPTLTEPLRPASGLRDRVADDALWEGVFERPLGELLEARLTGDVPRGVALTDGLIGTFSAPHAGDLRQNRCFLYHVIGDGSGLWKVPVGGMGALTAELTRVARAAGAELRAGAEVTEIDSDGQEAHVCWQDGSARGTHVLCACAPAVAAQLFAADPGIANGDPPAEGAQLKVNLLLRRLPRLRDPEVTPEEAFAGTFHVAEGYGELQAAHDAALAGRLPDPVPCEAYCHSLSDPSILGPELRAAGAHTLTVFALQLPARLFREDPAGAKERAVAATLRSLDAVLAEPIEDCLWRDGNGEPCLRATTPVELQDELAMPGGNIFHRDLAWPFAEDPDEVGRWGVETALPNVWLCGAGARRGGGVSGIPGHAVARALGVPGA